MVTAKGIDSLVGPAGYTQVNDVNSSQKGGDQKKPPFFAPDDRKLFQFIAMGEELVALGQHSCSFR